MQKKAIFVVSLGGARYQIFILLKNTGKDQGCRAVLSPPAKTRRIDPRGNPGKVFFDDFLFWVIWLITKFFCAFFLQHDYFFDIVWFWVRWNEWWNRDIYTTGEWSCDDEMTHRSNHFCYIWPRGRFEANQSLNGTIGDIKRIQCRVVWWSSRSWRNTRDR